MDRDERNRRTQREINQRIYDLCRAALAHAAMDMAMDDKTVASRVEMVARMMRLVGEWLQATAESFETAYDDEATLVQATNVVIEMLRPCLDAMNTVVRGIDHEQYGVKD
jgi:hypothetical protein